MHILCIYTHANLILGLKCKNSIIILYAWHTGYVKEYASCGKCIHVFLQHSRIFLPSEPIANSQLVIVASCTTGKRHTPRKTRLYPFHQHKTTPFTSPALCNRKADDIVCVICAWCTKNVHRMWCLHSEDRTKREL